ncbi:MAG: HlyD family efflux transporter periplasmic adaptor subunit [Acidobacteria bacterium]|nr:HlyD family efflux transporter periplasmic adaptor subunit [Acidobacteriota bacterium]
MRPSAQIDVAAEISGRVVWVSPVFQTGGRVGRGQALFRLDDAGHRHRVERARAVVAVQEVELLKVEEEARIARDQYERFRRRQAADSPVADTGPLALWEPQLRAAQAAVDRDRTALAEAELELSRTVVHAPFAGVVRAESVDVGHFVPAGEPVGQLFAADAVEVVVPLSDADAALIPGLWDLRPGDADRRVTARIVADYGNASHAWAGYVDRVEAALDEQTRTLDVVVHVPQPFAGGVPVQRAGRPEADSVAGADQVRSPPLLVGKFVDVRIDGLAPGRYFQVRRPALRPGNEVWAVRDGALTIVPVRVLQRFDDSVYVTGALTADQPVVVGGIEIATEGMAVRTAAEVDH